jgi:hypothetical protein
MSNMLWKNVLTNSKKSFMARMDLDNPKKLCENVCNYGLKRGEMAIRHSQGEYTNFTINALELIRPLLTNIVISRAIKYLSEDNISVVIGILHINKEAQDYGIDVIYYVLNRWLEKNEFDVPNEYTVKNDNFLQSLQRSIDPEFDIWILTVRNKPIQGKFKVEGIGQSKKKHSVVPEDWLNREFDSGKQLHEEMDTLDTRKGMAPVHFCCIYSMTLKKNDTWKKVNKGLNIDNVSIGVSISYKGSTITYLKTDDDRERFVKTLKKGEDYLLKDVFQQRVLIVVNLKEIVCDRAYLKKGLDGKKISTVGVLVSRLQKALRRGRECSKLMYDSVIELGKSKPYNLPDMQFAKVSGSRQLVWRLFISIFEDGRPYIKSDNTVLGMTDLAALSLLFQLDPNLNINDRLLKMVQRTALLVQRDDDKCWDWRKGSLGEVKDHGVPILRSFKMILDTMPMMRNDRNMIARGCNYLLAGPFAPAKLEKLSVSDMLQSSDDSKELSAKLAAYDMHCLPGMILELQASLPKNNIKNDFNTTKSIGSFIWMYSSRYNVRFNQKNAMNPFIEQMKKTLLEIQINYQGKNIELDDEILKSIRKNSCSKLMNIITPTKLESRQAFMLIFGKKVRIGPKKKKENSIEVIVGGSEKEPCKVKTPSGDFYSYLDGADRAAGEERYICHMDKSNKIQMVLEVPPDGFEWVDEIKKKVHIYVTKKNNKIMFNVDEIKDIVPFDGSRLIKPIPMSKDTVMNSTFKKIVKQALYNGNCMYGEFDINLIMREIACTRCKAKDRMVYKWSHLSKIDSIVWKNVLVKMVNCYDNQVIIGPVDRNGNKLQESISYRYEGVLWRMFNMLSMLYPFAVTFRSKFKFKINKNISEYKHLLKSVESLAFQNAVKSKKKKIVIKTKLWDHQEQTSKNIHYNIVKLGRRGHGDASCVGAGKTLVALKTMCLLLETNKENKFSGFVVLVPTTQLYKTWTDEIKRHTAGFHVLTQEANGSYKGEIGSNTVLITTLGRMRNHPVSHSWLFVVIDECLSVQNKNALQTEEAWRQIICSKYGVLLMSATFFRSRFDKMFYMLKMLRSNLPEKREFLDTILTESMVCHIPKTSRKWITTVTKCELSNGLKERYDVILSKSLDYEKMYMELSKLLYDNQDYVKMFNDRIVELSESKILIYARSKKMADDISLIDDVSRYPDKSKKHVVVSYAEGTYGLNDLIKYDTILSLVPDADKLPQMKGRLDRPGNDKDVLRLELILTKDTIEEASLIRMEMANTFYKQHIMPLAEFYEFACNS